MLQELKTERLRLRPFVEEDAHRIALLMNNWNVVHWMAVVPWPYTLNDANEFLERQAARDEAGFSLAIDNGDGIIGNIAVHTPKPEFSAAEEGTLEIGYWLGEPYWGQGYATEAVEAALTHAFDGLGAKRLVAGVATENPASAKVLEKLGFGTIGTGDFFCRPQDKRVAATLFALTRGRWRALQAVG